MRASAITRTQYTEFGTPVNTAGPPIGTRRLQIFPRSDVGSNLQAMPDAAGTGTVIVGTSGFNVIVDGLQGIGSVDVSADRLVIWTAAMQQNGTPNQALQSDDTPLEIYMEGNVVFRQGNRTIHAPSMYYDVRQKIGVVLNAEMLTPIPTPGLSGPGAAAGECPAASRAKTASSAKESASQPADSAIRRTKFAPAKPSFRTCSIRSSTR